MGFQPWRDQPCMSEPPKENGSLVSLNIVGCVTSVAKHG